MKTNIEIDDKILNQAMDLSGIKTVEELIDKALDNFVYFLALKKLDAARGPDLWQGDLEEMRTNTFNGEK